MLADSSWLNKRRGAGLVTIFFGTIGTVWSGAAGWAIGKSLDYLIQNLTWATLVGLPWGAMLSGGAMTVGMALLFWPASDQKPLHRLLHSHVDRALARYASVSIKDWKDANLLGNSVAISLKKAGFEVPPDNDDWAVRASMLQQYFKEIKDLLNDGHMKEAKERASVTVSRLSKEFLG